MDKRAGLVVVGALMIAAAYCLPPAFDEVYYWTWASAPGWTYYDHPPGVAWAIAAARAVFGDGLLALRVVGLGGAAVVAGASVASARCLAKDPRDASYLALLTLAGSMMFVIGYLPATPDVVQGAVLALATYALIRSRTSRVAAVVAAALFVGGIVVKHSSALVLIGVAATLAVRRPRVFISPWPWLGAALGAALLVPWWLADTEGSTAFQAARVFSAAKVRGVVGVPLTVGAMLLTLGVPFTVAFFALPVRRLSVVESALTAGAWCLVLACAVAAWLGTGEINWVMPALVVALPVVVARLSAKRRMLYVVVTAVTAAVWAAGLLHIVTPYLPLEPAKDRTLRSAGFDVIAAEAEALARTHGADTLVARRYQIASMMRFWTADRLAVYELGTSRASQYDRWPRPPLREGDRAVVVLPSERLPDGLTPLGPATRVEQTRAGRALGTYVLTPVVVSAEFTRQ